MRQGWKKNEIIYECQRVFGNDVLIEPRRLDDERTLFGKYGIPLSMFMLVTGIGLRRKVKAR